MGKYYFPINFSNKTGCCSTIFLNMGNLFYLLIAIQLQITFNNLQAE